MSNNTKIFSEAIAEAKAIRETAMANAKLALEEAFAPRIQEMMSDKLEAMSQEEDEMKEDYGQATDDAAMDAANEEISLEELLAELEGLEEGEEEMEEGIGSAIKGAASNVSKGLEKAYDKIANAKPLFSDEPLEKFSKKFMKTMSGDEKGYGLNREGVDEDLTEAEDDDEVGTISVDELKDIIRGIMADVMGGGEEEEAGEEEMEAGEEEMEAGEDDLELEEILAEIANLEEGDEEEMEEGIGSAIKGAAQNISKGAEKAYDKIANAKPLFSDEPLEKFSKKFRKVMSGDEKGYGLNREGVDENEELQEAMNTIATLRSELNEVNLLNAKLLYVNKLFKAKNLNEAQKVKVINAFDRAETVREAKNVFDTLNESLNTEKAKSQIKESLSFASKSAGVSDRQPIMEGNDFVNRMQKLAGII